MAKFNFDHIKKVGKLSDLRVVVIAGSNTLFADLVVRDIKDRKDVEKTENNTLAGMGTSIADEFDASDEEDATLNLDAFFKVCNTRSAFGRWLCKADYDFASKKDKERIKAYIKKPSEHALLIVTVADFRNVREFRNMRALEASKTAHYIDIQYPRKIVLGEIVDKLFKDKGFNIGETARNLFIMRMGSAYNEYTESIDTICSRLEHVKKANPFENLDGAVIGNINDSKESDSSDGVEEQSEHEDCENEADDGLSVLQRALGYDVAALYSEVKETAESIDSVAGVDSAVLEMENTVESIDEQEKVKTVEVNGQTFEVTPIESDEETEKIYSVDIKDFKEAMKGINFFEIEDFLRQLLVPVHSTKCVSRRKIYRILNTLLEEYQPSEICKRLKYRVEELLYYRAYVNCGYIPIKVRYNTDLVKERLPEDSRLRKATSLAFKRNAYISSLTSLSDWYFMYSILSRCGVMATEEQYMHALLTLMQRTAISNDRLMNAIRIKNTLEETLYDVNSLYYSDDWLGWSTYDACREKFKATVEEGE